MSSEILATGVELAGFRIGHLLGRGGMGVVYLAEDRRLNRNVALKLIAPELSGDRRFRERFLHESELAASLDHENVIPIYEAGDAEGQLYLAMRYVDGTDLASLLRAEHTLTPSRAVAILRQVAAALDAAHGRGLVHRDVKPSNILLAANEHVYLADFGLTRSLGSSGPTAEYAASLGTVGYVAPEQVEGGAVEPSADVYSLGCVLYETLAGSPPFSSASPIGVLWEHLEAPPPSARARRPELPAALDGVIARALSKQPSERPGTCGELVEDAAAALGLTATTRSRRSLWMIAGAIAAAAAAVGIAVPLTTGGGAAEPPLVVGPTSLVRIDPDRNEPAAAIDVGARYGIGVSLAVGTDAVWVADLSGGTVSRVDIETGAVSRTVAVRMAPRDVSVDPVGVWAVGSSAGSGQLVRLDPLTGTLGVTFPLPLSSPVAVAAAGQSVWIAANDLDGSALLRVRADTGEIEVMVPFDSNLIDVVIDGDTVWATTGMSTGSAGAGTAIAATEIEAATGSVLATIPLEGVILGNGSEPLAAGLGALWAVGGSELARIDPQRRAMARTHLERNEVYSVAVHANGIWLATGDGDGSVWRVDPKTREVTARIPLARSAVISVAAGPGGIWAY